MATNVPLIYQSNNPIITPNLSPLQLALANYMVQGSPMAYGPNQRFVAAMKVYSDTLPLSPVDIDPRTGLVRQPSLGKDIIGINYEAIGDDIYVYRRAQDCGPDENRFEYAYIGKRAEIASGTWTYYALRVGSGSVSDGTYFASGTGGGDGGKGTSCTDGGGTCGACFLPHTLVTMADGTKKRIDEIKAGDYVKEALTNQSVKVIGLKEIEHNPDTWIFSLSNEMPYITEEHPWYNENLELCAMSDLAKKLAPWLGHIKIVEVANKIKIKNPINVYNLMLEQGESFYANDLAVNNIVKTGTAYVLLAKGYLSQAAYENYVHNLENSEFDAESQTRIFNLFHNVSRYVLDNNNWKGKLLAKIVAWAVTNRSKVVPIVRWFKKHPKIRDFLFKKYIS